MAWTCRRVRNNAPARLFRKGADGQPEESLVS
jgi:hypothetical protein